jgi:hypothetical protein
MSLTVTTSGNPSFTTAKRRIGTKSLLLNTSNPDYLLIDSQHNALFSSLNDFTVEFWYYDTYATLNIPISSSGFEIEFSVNVTLNLSVRINGTDVYRQRQNNDTIYEPYTWQHFAFVRSNNTVAVYINGNIQTNRASSTYSQSANLSDLVIGAKDYGQSGFQNGWDGYLDELRISNVARYTSIFAPIYREFSVDSSTLLLMHMEDLSALSYVIPKENIVPYYISTGTMSVYPPPKNVGGDFNSDLFWTADGDKANFPTLQGTLTCPNGLKFGDGSFQNSASTGSSMTVEEETGSLSVPEVHTIKVSDGFLTDVGNGVVIVDVSAGGGGSGTLTVDDGSTSAANVSTLDISALGSVVNNSGTAILFSGGSKVSSTQTYTTTLTDHQFLIDPFNTTNVTTNVVTSSGSVTSYSGSYLYNATVKTDNLGIRHFKFDGLGDYISFPTSPSTGTIDQIPSNGNLSMWFWSCLDKNDTSTQLYITTRSTNPRGGMNILKSSTGYEIGFSTAAEFAYYVNTNIQPSTGWQMVLVTLAYNQSNSNYDLKMYLDGVDVFTGTAGEYEPATEGVRIGHYRTNQDSLANLVTFEGKIGHCGITNIALTSAQIAAIYAELKPYYLTLGLFAGDLTGDLIGNADTATKIADINNSDIVQLTATQELTNKTLTAPDVTGLTALGDGSSNPGQIQLNCELNSHSVTLKGPAHATATTYSLQFPENVGTSGDVLQTDGAGALSWVAQSGGVAPTLDQVLTSGASLTSFTSAIDLTNASAVTVPTPSANTDATTKTYVDSAITTATSGLAPTASPTFTGTVTVPTPSAGTDATTKTYVDSAITTATSGLAPTASPTFTGTVTVPTPSAGTDATTKTYVDSAITTATSGLAPTASPTFTGTVTVPTPSAGTDATTKTYVDSAITTATSGLAPIASPTFTGTVSVTDGTYSYGIQLPSTMSSNYTLQFPDSAGSSGYVLETDGAGVLSWVAQSGGGGGGGSLTVTDGINSISSAHTIEFPSGMLTNSSGSTATLQAPTLDQVVTVNNTTSSAISVGALTATSVNAGSGTISGGNIVLSTTTASATYTSATSTLEFNAASISYETVNEDIDTTSGNQDINTYTLNNALNNGQYICVIKNTGSANYINLNNPSTVTTQKWGYPADTYQVGAGESIILTFFVYNGTTYISLAGFDSATGDIIVDGSITSTGALTAASVNAGTGAIQTTGTVSTGALTATSVNAGTGAIVGGSITASSLGLGNGSITAGSISAGQITATSQLFIGYGASFNASITSTSFTFQNSGAALCSITSDGLKLNTTSNTATSSAYNPPYTDFNLAFDCNNLTYKNFTCSVTGVGTVNRYEISNVRENGLYKVRVVNANQNYNIIFDKGSNVGTFKFSSTTSLTVTPGNHAVLTFFHIDSTTYVTFEAF